MSEIKSLLLDQLGLSPSIVLLLAGAIAHAALCMLLRLPITSAWGLLAPLGLGLLVEGYELWDHYGDIGLTAPGNDPVTIILLRHSVDVLKLLALPVAMVLGGLFAQR